MNCCTNILCPILKVTFFFSLNNFHSLNIKLHNRVVMQFICSEQFRFCIQNHTLINSYFYIHGSFSPISNIKKIQLSYLIVLLKLVTITKLIARHNQMEKCQKSNVYRVFHLWNMQIDHPIIDTLSLTLFE